MIKSFNKYSIFNSLLLNLLFDYLFFEINKIKLNLIILKKLKSLAYIIVVLIPYTLISIILF